jgi:hypothetical protein
LRVRQIQRIACVFVQQYGSSEEYFKSGGTRLSLFEEGRASFPREDHLGRLSSLVRANVSFIVFRFVSDKRRRQDRFVSITEISTSPNVPHDAPAGVSADDLKELAFEGGGSRPAV